MIECPFQILNEYVVYFWDTVSPRALDSFAHVSLLALGLANGTVSVLDSNGEVQPGVFVRRFFLLGLLKKGKLCNLNMYTEHFKSEKETTPVSSSHTRERFSRASAARDVLLVAVARDRAGVRGRSTCVKSV